MEYIKKAKERTEEDRAELTEAVSRIIRRIRREGDPALAEYNKTLDGCGRKELKVSREEIEEAYREADPGQIRAMKAARENIEAFARAQRDAIRDLPRFEPVPGVVLGHRVLPVDSCMCYVPGGSYPLYSTALMLAVPAAVAGVRRIAGCSPPVRGTDRIHPLTLVAMDIGGIDEIYVAGGAHAVAAFSYGTGSIRPVDLIVGPGNRFVAEAKRQCYGQVGIDFVAGPSEVLIIADETADPALLAADLLAQSEHDPFAKGILLTTSRQVAEETIRLVGIRLESLSTAPIAARSWNDYGEVILCGSLEEAAGHSNRCAPEHLELHIREPERLMEALTSYGSLFMGGFTAEVFGDYASGTNHTLPTLGAARYTGGVFTGTFLKICTHQTMTEEGVLRIAPLTETMARGEGLEAHALAAALRLEKARQQKAGD